MSVLSVAVAVLFGGLWVVTLLSQWRRVRPISWLKRHDACAVIPVWTFFAPNPGTRDVRLLWRQRYADGTLSPWRETTAPRVGPWKGIWNPAKRVRKAVTDVSPSVLRRAVTHPDSSLTVISVPYLMIVNHVSSLPGASLANARQFMIAYTDGSDRSATPEPKIQLVSHWHLLEAPQAAPAQPMADAAVGALARS
jgi:hypothetical protein